MPQHIVREEGSKASGQEEGSDAAKHNREDEGQFVTFRLDTTLVPLRDNDIQVLNGEQDISLRNVDDFRLAVRKLLDCEKEQLILNLSKVVYLNSAALGVIADAALVAGKHRKQLVVAGVQPTRNHGWGLCRDSLPAKLRV